MIKEVMRMIETERLLLRPFFESDAEDLLAYLKEPLVNCFACMKLNTSEEAKEEAKRRAKDAEYCFAIVLKENGKVVFLRAKLETLKERLEGDKSRPLLQGEEPLTQKLNRLISARYPVYEDIADFIVDVDEKSVDEVVNEIISKVQKD